MPWLDARLPLRFGPLDSREPGEAVLTDGAAAAPPTARFAPDTAHPSGCACCLPRSAAADALSRLFRERAVSAGPPFRAVLAAVGPVGEAAIREALNADPLASGRFRLHR